MLLSTACFTITVLLVRALGTFGSISVWLITCVRFVVGLAVILSVYYREFQPRHLLSNRKLIVRGVVGGTGVFLTYLCVIKLGAGRATFINNTYVVWGAFLAAWLLREKLRPNVVVGGLAALVGLTLLTSIFSSTRPPGIFDLVAIMSAFLAGYVVVAIRQLHSTEHTSTIFASQCFYGLLICLGPAVVSFEPLPLAAWGVLVLAALCAGFGQLAMTRAYRDLPVAEGSLIQMLVPLGIAIGGIVFFNERFVLPEVLGAALILAGTGITALRRTAKPVIDVTK